MEGESYGNAIKNGSIEGVWSRATIRRLLCLCFGIHIYIYISGILVTLGVEQSFERRRITCQKRKAGGAIPVGQEERRRKAPLPETPPTVSATDSASV